MGPLKIFGSPYGHWGSHNDAFAHHRDVLVVVGEAGVVVPDTPCVLPRKGTGDVKEDASVAALVRQGGVAVVVPAPRPTRGRAH